MNDTLRTARTNAFDKLALWAEQDPPKRDNMLLLQAEPTAWIGGMGPVILRGYADRAANFRIVLAKPRGEGETYRELDPEGLALIIGLCLPSGRIAIEGKGASGDYYYVRLYLGGARDDGKLRRVHLAPVIADTPSGMHTVEAADYHSLERRNLRARDKAADERISKYGTEEAKAFAVERWSEMAEAGPHLLPHGVDARTYASLLDALHARLKAVPLGEGLGG